MSTIKGNARGVEINSQNLLKQQRSKLTWTIIIQTPNVICRGTDTHTYLLTYTQIISQYSGISSHSFGRSYWNSTNLYFMICVYIICMFKVCINVILSNAICIYTICIHTVCIYIHLIRWIHIIIVIMLSLFSVVKVANSHVRLWTCTDAPWFAQRRSVCSSPVLLAAPLSEGSSHC